VISDLRSEILSYECECRYWFNENTHLHRQCNYITRQNIIQKRQYEVLRKRNEFLSTKIKDQVDKENQRKIITTLYADIKDLKSKHASKEQQLLTELNKVSSVGLYFCELQIFRSNLRTKINRKIAKITRKDRGQYFSRWMLSPVVIFELLNSTDEVQRTK